jgi:cell division ATPase FtsA
VTGHKACLTDQLELILSDGVQQGAFQIAGVKATAQAIFDAVTRFHHPAHADEWNDPQLPARIDAVIALVLRGIEAPRKR